LRDAGDQAQDRRAEARQDGDGVHEERLDRFEGAQHPRKHDDRHGAEKQAQQCDRHADSLPRQRLCRLAVYRGEKNGRGDGHDHSTN